MEVWVSISTYIPTFIGARTAKVNVAVPGKYNSYL